MSEQKKGRLGKYTRRGFLGLGLLAGGAFAVGYYYYQKPYPNPLEDDLAEGEVTFNPYVKISADNQITIIAPRAEMGQGVQTTLAALVAEELEVAIDDVNVEHGPSSSAYFNAVMMEESPPFAKFDDSFTANAMRSAMGVAAKFFGLQGTGGSSAIADGYEKMRKAGCAARMVLLQAAADHWGTQVERLKAADAHIVNEATGEKIPYGQLASKAAKLDAPSDMELKPKSGWTQLGKSQTRAETIEKITGAPIFGIDVQLPDMLYGAVTMSPRFGARAKSADLEAARAITGVVDVIEIDTHLGHGYGVIAQNTWAAFQGTAALNPEWDTADYPTDSAGMRQVLTDAISSEPTFSLGNEGDPELVFADAASETMVEVEYDVPFLAHTTMEPMTATAWLKDGQLDIWTGHQAPGIAEIRCADALGLETGQVTVHTTFLGGGFGRRTEVDAPMYAALLSRHTNGRPIKLTYTREEDTQHDMYRPMAKAKLRAKVGANGIEAIDTHIAVPSIIKSAMSRLFPSLSPSGPEKVLLEGTFNQPYVIGDKKFDAHVVDLGIPVGFWRSVGHSCNSFFYESFIDEAAAKAGQDPLAFRQAMMGDDRFHAARGVLAKVAEMADWGSPLPAGKGRGIAQVISYGTWVAEVVEVDMRDGNVKIDKVFCAADPGTVLDPENFKAQMMSGIIYGLSAAMMQEITFSDGMVEQGNFDSYDAMRQAQCPEIHVELLENWHMVGGAGEPGTPPVAPALANAIFAASGKRIRQLPMHHEVDFA